MNSLQLLRCNPGLPDVPALGRCRRLFGNGAFGRYGDALCGSGDGQDFPEPGHRIVHRRCPPGRRRISAAAH